MVDKTSKLLKKMTVQPAVPITDNMFLPNHSGDHDAGQIERTPTADFDIPNKKYVDDTAGGTGDVTAAVALTDETIVQGDGGSKGVKTSTATITQIESSVTHVADVTGDPHNIAADTLTFTNKTLDQDGTGNSITNIANASIKAGAAIDYDKLAALTDANLLIGNASNVAVVVAVTGDVTISNAGVTTIGAAKVETDMVEDNAITLAKMAGGTDGNLITYDASGDPAFVTTGNATEVLTSNGAGTAPTFQAAGGGGGAFTLINNDMTSTSVTGTTYGTVDTYTGITMGADDMIMIKIHGTNTTAGTARARLTFGDGTNTDVGDEMRFNSSTAIDYDAELWIGQRDSGTTGELVCRFRSGGTADGSVGSSTETMTAASKTTLTNVTAWANVTQILLEIRNNNASGVHEVDHVIVLQVK